MPGQRRPNELWKAAVRQSGRSLAQVADVIHQVSLESGTRPLYYDRSSLTYWSSGVTPQADAIPVIVEAMSRLLGRPDLSPADLGWPDHAHDQQHPWHGDAVARLALLGRSSLDRRAFLGTSIVLLSALDVPQHPWHQPRRPGDPQRVGAADIARLKKMTRQFAQADSLFGGTEALPSLGAYVSQIVTPMLRARSGNRAPELFSAASELAYIGGWMSSDAGEAGLAQRYYVLSARLADEAGDRPRQTTALRGLALHAIEMGHPRKAIDLADAAASALPHTAEPRLRAMIAGTLAQAHAAAGERWTAMTCLNSAQADVDRATSAPDSECAYDHLGLAHQTGIVLTDLGDPATSLSHLTDALTNRTDDERRSRVLINARLAAAQVAAGAPDAAGRTLVAIEPDIAIVQSARVNKLLTQAGAGLPESTDSAIQRARHIVTEATT